MINIIGYNLPEENNEGNIEYKREILNFEKCKNKYVSQMIFRLNEGNGIAYYYLGVNDNGTFYDWTKEEKKKSLKNFIELVLQIDANIIYILEFNSGYKIKIKSHKYNNSFLWKQFRAFET